MRVLTITGDPTFKAGHPRFDVQARAVEKYEVLYWGSGTKIPTFEKGSFDVVTTQDPFFRGMVGARIAKKIGARLNVQVHADLHKQNFIKRLIAPHVLKKAGSIRVVSNAINEQVQVLKVKAPVTVLPIFLDLEPFEALERVPDPQPTILWIGRFEHEKDPLKAVSVLKQVRERITEARLVMLGSGSLEESLKSATKGLPIDFPGWQDTKPYLAKAHVVLSTSHAESWGASIVESLAAGVPVVAPDVGVAKEAGATVVPRGELDEAVVDALLQKQNASLQLPLLSEEEWVQSWKESL